MENNNLIDSEQQDARQRSRIHKKVARKARRRKICRIALPIFGVLLVVFMLNIIILPLTGGYKRVDSVDSYDGDNNYITFDKPSGLLLSAHRAGGDLAPEETLSAFKLCMQATDYSVDVLEFDLHLTKDGHLVLLHDHEVDRTSNGPEVFGQTGVKVCEKTLAELKTLNFGYNYKNVGGVYPYRNLQESEVPDDVRILSLEEVLNYLENARPDKSLHYIIEIKDDGDIGRQAMDKLYDAMCAHDILNRTVVGTFKGDITKYIDTKYKGIVTRSAGITEMLNFYYAFLWGRNLNPQKLGYRVLQIPMGLIEMLGKVTNHAFFDFSSKAFIDYAHHYGIAVQYWTINDEDSVELLIKNGADCIMTDNPAMAYQVKSRM